MAHEIKTFRRDRLMRLAQAGKLRMVDGYSYDDMSGESRTQGADLPVAMKPADYRERQEGVCYVSEFYFQSGSGRAWLNPNGTVTLYVHSNHNLTFRIVE